MSYYQISIQEIPIGWSGEPKLVPVYPEGEAEDVPVVVKKLTIEQWKDAWESDSRSDKDPWCRLAIEDNGKHGDGINIEIRVGSHKIVRTLLPDDSLDTLIAALAAIRELRKSE